MFWSSIFPALVLLKKKHGFLFFESFCGLASVLHYISTQLASLVLVEISFASTLLVWNDVVLIDFQLFFEAADRLSKTIDVAIFVSGVELLPACGRFLLFLCTSQRSQRSQNLLKQSNISWKFATDLASFCVWCLKQCVADLLIWIVFDSAMHAK